MISRHASLALCALIGVAGSASLAGAQGAPFTIRRPPDGATVREKVRVEIPRESISIGGFVAFFIDGRFDVAVAPAQNAHGPFTYVWDTKGLGASDGEHTIRAVLFEPAADSSSDTVTEKGSSEVKVTVANKIHRSAGPITLRYHYREGQNLNYARDGRTYVVGGVSDQGTTTSDTDLAKVRSKLLLQIEDVQPSVSLVRNKLTSLSILSGAQETTYDPSQLSASMYQEIDPIGRVRYETGADSGLDQFANQGLPVNNTLELPLLPSMPVSVGEQWNTANQRLDVPGLTPEQQPRVTLVNKFEDFEWQNGYPTAKIHQSYTGPIRGQSELQVGGINITSPSIRYERDIYVAYKSGTLVETVRSLTISGRTTQAVTPQATAGMGAPPMMGGMGGPGMGGPGGNMQQMMMQMYSQQRQNAGAMGQPGGGAPNMGQMMQQYYQRGMGRGGPGGFAGGPGGFGGGKGRFGGMGQGGMPFGAGGPPMGSGFGGGPFGGGAPAAAAGATGQDIDHPITIRAVTDTQLVSGGR